MIQSELELEALKNLLSNFEVDKLLINTRYLNDKNKKILNTHFDNLVYWLKEEIQEYERLCVAKQNEEAARSKPEPKVLVEVGNQIGQTK